MLATFTGSLLILDPEIPPSSCGYRAGGHPTNKGLLRTCWFIEATSGVAIVADNCIGAW